MFLPDSPFPKDIKQWAIQQLQSKSPALGVKRIRSYHKPEVEEWPKSLQPNLQKRDEMFWAFKENKEKFRRNLPGFQTEADKSRNRQENLMQDRKSTRLNSSHSQQSRMPSSA